MPRQPRAYESSRGERASGTEGTLADARARHDPYAAFRFAGFRFYALANLISVIGRQMLSVAVGWELYARTHSATALGLVGLMIGAPVIFLALPAGHCADRFDRRKIQLATQALSAVSSFALALVSWAHLALPPLPILRAGNHLLQSTAAVFERQSPFHFDDPSLPIIYALLLVSATARTFGWAARSAFFPTLVPVATFSNAVTWNSSMFQIGSVAGPALGGLLIVRAGFPFIYALDGFCALAFLLLLVPIQSPPQTARGEKMTRDTLAAGLRFVWKTKIVLATITLDLFAVLLGGATALLPMFADQILHAGPVALGWMRAAPAVGAFVMAVVIAYLPPMKHAGRTLLWAVAGFGAATIVFALSRSLALSLLALFATGAFDSVSVVVRHTLVQLLTPDAMRGRVSAVNNVFIGSSNELGALESGLTAAWFGPVLSVLLGGIGTIAVVLATAIIWPEVRRFGPLARGAEPRG